MSQVASGFTRASSVSQGGVGRQSDGRPVPRSARANATGAQHLSGSELQRRQERGLAMKVSVVIPLYNKARHIARAVQSVRGQTWQDFEIIVVDDGSTDGSGDVVRQIADARFRLITQLNGGECAARNRGIAEAACDVVAFLDADDEWLPAFLETVVALRQRFPDCGMYATA
jgi:cellulose synthase/poly-beta-1,6-N-acetylglucosamine synthase-like glycosyltransferase